MEVFGLGAYDESIDARRYAVKIVFAGTPDFAVPSLQALLASEHEVVAVYTQPDRPKGRGRVLTPPPVKVAAEQAGIPVLQPVNLKDPVDVEQLRAWGADYLVVAAYGLLLSDEVLAIPKQLPINVHASLLPRWRGASPIQQAILAGDAEAGVTIMQMVKQLDAGAMLHKVSCPIELTDTSQSLHDKLAVLGAEGLLAYLSAPEQYAGQAQEESLVTYAGKISKQDALLDWNKPAAVLEREVRGYNPWPISQFARQGKMWRVWQAAALPGPEHAEPGEVTAVDKKGIVVATSQGLLRLESLQKPGGKPVAVADLLNAHQDLFKVGERLS
jgi:methionyl-tRNA formyltransferase